MPNKLCFFLLSVVVSLGEDVAGSSAKEECVASDLEMSVAFLVSSPGVALTSQHHSTERIASCLRILQTPVVSRVGVDRSCLLTVCFSHNLSPRC